MSNLEGTQLIGPPPTRLGAEVERLRRIAERQASFIEEIAHFAPGSLGVRACALLVELGAWRPEVERDARPDPLVAKLRGYADRRDSAGYEEAAAEIRAIADELEQR